MTRVLIILKNRENNGTEKIGLVTPTPDLLQPLHWICEIYNETTAFLRINTPYNAFPSFNIQTHWYCPLQLKSYLNFEMHQVKKIYLAPINTLWLSDTYMCQYTMPLLVRQWIITAWYQEWFINNGLSVGLLGTYCNQIVIKLLQIPC